LSFFVWIRKTEWVWLLCSAVLSAIPFCIPSLFFLSWISYTPFFLVLLKNREKSSWFGALGRGILFGFFYHAAVYFWFLWLYPLHFAGLNDSQSVAVVMLAWLGISLCHGALYAVPTLLGHLVSKAVRSSGMILFSGILGILAAQRMTELSELAFPWVRVSLGHYRAPLLIQSASLFGAEGLDFIILSVSAFLAWALCETAKKKRNACVCVALSIFVANFFFGAFRMVISEQREKESFTVLMVQGNILSGEKWSGDDVSFETYWDLTSEFAQEGVDLVVWPESAVPVNLKTNPDYLSLYQQLSQEVKAPILMGCFWKDGEQTTNSALLIGEEEVSEPYSKRHLVPFGEKMPYRAVLSKLFPFLEKINMLSSDLASGADSALMEFQGHRIGTVICFESMFPSLVRDSAAEGAELLVVITNDSWYEDSPAVWEHLAHSVFRSVETGRSIIRCANSGVSAMIRENGVIEAELGPLKQGVLKAEANFAQTPTLYTLIGPILFPVLCGVFAIWFAGLIFWERRNRRG